MYGPGYAVDDPARTNFVGNFFLISFYSILLFLDRLYFFRPPFFLFCFYFSFLSLPLYSRPAETLQEVL